MTGIAAPAPAAPRLGCAGTHATGIMDSTLVPLAEESEQPHHGEEMAGEHWGTG